MRNHTQSVVFAFVRVTSLDKRPILKVEWFKFQPLQFHYITLKVQGRVTDNQHMMKWFHNGPQSGFSIRHLIFLSPQMFVRFCILVPPAIWSSQLWGDQRAGPALWSPQNPLVPCHGTRGSWFIEPGPDKQSEAKAFLISVKMIFATGLHSFECWFHTFTFTLS